MPREYTLRIPFARNSFCIGLKKSQKASHVFGASDSLNAGLGDQIAPDMKRLTGLLDRSKIETPLLGHTVIKGRVQQRRLTKLRLLQLDDIAHILQSVVPGVLGRIVAGASWKIRSGTTPLVSAETVFWFSAMNGITVRSILLPLIFS